MDGLLGRHVRRNICLIDCRISRGVEMSLRIVNRFI